MEISLPCFSFCLSLLSQSPADSQLSEIPYIDLFIIFLSLGCCGSTQLTGCLEKQTSIPLCSGGWKTMVRGWQTRCLARTTLHCRQLLSPFLGGMLCPLLSLYGLYPRTRKNFQVFIPSSPTMDSELRWRLVEPLSALFLLLNSS